MQRFLSPNPEKYTVKCVDTWHHESQKYGINFEFISRLAEVCDKQRHKNVEAAAESSYLLWGVFCTLLYKNAKRLLSAV